MTEKLTHNLPRIALGLALSALAVTASAQTRLSLPAGTVIIVQTTSPLQSNSAQTGQTFETTVVDAIGLDNYAVIPPPRRHFLSNRRKTHEHRSNRAQTNRFGSERTRSARRRTRWCWCRNCRRRIDEQPSIQHTRRPWKSLVASAGRSRSSRNSARSTTRPGCLIEKRTQTRHR